MNISFESAVLPGEVVALPGLFLFTNIFEKQEITGTQMENKSKNN
ncbi:hypothetical protein' [Enterococcus faecium]|nr:hypothetical protein D357_00871 [Enterococcus faecium SD3B-2]EPI23474.1 hypothetical protein D352_01067 [Enterococcus faecium LA4B-2]CUX98678.1 hypothetical protein' [Enterococcus faecium]